MPGVFERNLSHDLYVRAIEIFEYLFKLIWFEMLQYISLTDFFLVA